MSRATSPTGERSPLRYTYRTEPYAHQKRALAKVARLDGNAGLFMPMRTGKTKVAIDWAGIAYHNHGLRKVLIVCPISVISVWVDEIQKHSPVPGIAQPLRQSAATNAEDVKHWTEHPDTYERIHWLVINYEMVWRKIAGGGPQGGDTTLDQVIARWKPDLVIADEAHKLKNPQSRQSKALARLGQAARMRLALTGTPVTKAPLDLFGLFRFVDPDALGQKTWAGFKDHYAEWEPARYEPRIKIVKRYKNLDELVARTRAHSFRVKLEDCFDLPAKTYQTIPVPLRGAARKAYDDMAHEMIAYLEGGRVATADIVLEKLIRLSQITSGFVKDAEGKEVDIHSEKLSALMDLISDMVEQDEKVVVFCRFKHDYHRISSKLTQGGIRYAMLTGETRPSQRSVEIELFQTEPDIKVFVAQTQAGSLGIDLSAARLAVFYSLDYNWATYQQAQDRILNVRNPRPLGIYHLVCPRTIDVVQLRVLKSRGDLADALIHNPRALLDSDLLNPPQ